MGLFGSRGYSGLFFKIHDDNFLANDMSKNVERGDRGHVLPHFKQIWGISRFCQFLPGPHQVGSEKSEK